MDIEQTSIYSQRSKNYNPFYHPQGDTASSRIQGSKMSAADLLQQQNEERRKLKEHKDQLMDEWGFQNEETKRMFEARMNNAKKKKKKKVLSAEEKYKRFLMIKNSK